MCHCIFTVTGWVTIVAQPLPALTAIPGGEDTAMADVTVKCTRTLLVSGSIVAIVQSDGVVSEGKRMDDGPYMTSTTATTVLPNQILGKL